MTERNRQEKYHCPRCGNEEIIEFDDFIQCIDCELDFDKEFLGKLDDENILSRQELGGISDAFDEDERRRILE